jgi:hypothetical protein
MSSPAKRTPEARLKDIFPGGFDARFGIPSSRIPSSISCNGDHLTTKPEQLYYTLVERYDPETHPESIIVKSAWYGKQTKAAQPEFIVLQVEDIRIEGLVNYIVLDRNVGNDRGRLVSSRITTANDAFRVSYDGNIKQLLQQCQLTPYKFLEQLSFPSDQPLRLYELVTLAKIVSGRYPDYHMLDSSCYLFAGVIWECMHRMRPSADYQDALAKKRGKCRWFRYIPNNSEMLETLEEIEGKLPRIERELEERRNVSSFEPLYYRFMLIHIFTPKGSAFEQIRQGVANLMLHA